MAYFLLTFDIGVSICNQRAKIHIFYDLSAFGLYLIYFILCWVERPAGLNDSRSEEQGGHLFEPTQ